MKGWYMRILSALIGIIFVLFVVLFSVSNLTTVTVSLWPFPFSATAPLFVIILSVAVISFLLGGLFVWLNNIAKSLSKSRKQKNIAKTNTEAALPPKENIV